MIKSFSEVSHLTALFIHDMKSVYLWDLFYGRIKACTLFRDAGHTLKKAARSDDPAANSTYNRLYGI